MSPRFGKQTPDGFNRQALDMLSGLMGVEASVVEAMLTLREVKAGGEVYTKKLSVQDANLTRDALVKSMYEVRLW